MESVTVLSETSPAMAAPLFPAISVEGGSPNKLESEAPSRGSSGSIVVLFFFTAAASAAPIKKPRFLALTSTTPDELMLPVAASVSLVSLTRLPIIA